MLLSKTARKYVPNMRLIMKAKIDYPQNHDVNSLVQLLHVDVVFTVESPKSMSCDAMTNVGSCLDENS